MKAKQGLNQLAEVNMKKKQIFLIEHERSRLLKANEIKRALGSNFEGVLEEGSIRVKELKMSPHSLSSLNK